MTKPAAPACARRTHHPVSGSDDLQVSIVITTYRRQPMLAELLKALRPQVVNCSAEVIIVDNCPAASARAVVHSLDDPALFYVHELQSGVVHARNRAVRTARGTYVIFLDDDEVPATGWLDAWLEHADGLTDMSFGRVVPRFLNTCPAELAGQVERMFSRDLGHAAEQEDISAFWAYLGTGNAMFHKQRCLGEAEPFDLRFNASGGEDVWLIGCLIKRGLRALWNEKATVEELVPHDRMTLPYLRARRHSQGQLRCILMYGDGGMAGCARVLVWMGIGAVQLVGGRLAALIALWFAPRLAPEFLCTASGGAGKLLWWRTSQMKAYSGG